MIVVLIVSLGIMPKQFYSLLDYISTLGYVNHVFDLNTRDPAARQCQLGHGNHVRW